MAQYQAQIGENAYTIQLEDGQTLLNGQSQDLSFVPAGIKGEFHLLINHQSVPCFVHELEDGSLEVTLKGQKRTVIVKNETQLLLDKFGMNHAAKSGKAQVNAPMPGLVVSIAVSEGETVKKGDRLLVLEAMKMENEIKAPVDGVVQKVAVSAGDAVAKNALLVSF